MTQRGSKKEACRRAIRRPKAPPSGLWPVRICSALWLIALLGLWTVGLLVLSGCGAGDGVESIISQGLPSAQSKSVSEPTRPQKPRLLSSAPKPERIQRSSATVALAKGIGRTLAYVADEDARAILTVDVDTGQQLSKTSLGAAPSSLLTLPDGRVLVTLSDVSRLAVFVPAEQPALPLRAHSVVDVPTEPTAIAATPLSDRVLVVSRWGSKLAEVKLPPHGDAFVSRTLELESDPFSGVVSRDGKRAFVSHVTGGKVSEIDLGTWSATTHEHSRRTGGAFIKPMPQVRKVRSNPSFDLLEPSIRFPTARPRHRFQRRTTRRRVSVERTPVHAHAMVSVEDEIIIPVSEIFPGEKTRITTGYGSSIIEERPVQERLLSVSGLDGTKRTSSKQLPRCRLPRAAAHDGQGRVFVACQGDSSVASTGTWGSVSVPSGPTGLAWDAGKARLVVWSQQSRQLSVVRDDPAAASTAKPAPHAVVSHAMPFVSRDALVTHGRELFFATDRRISSDGRSCASCHPGGRQDGLVWSTPNGPRQTPMLAGKLSGTAPYGWNGSAKSIEDHLTQTFKRLGGSGLTDHDQSALVAYVKSLRVPTSKPQPTRAQLVAEGKNIFHSSEAECSSCHVEKRSFSDTMSYPIVRATADRTADFNTPALVGLANTAPYFHDGRFPTLLAMLDGTDGKMGHSAHLSLGQKEALVAYLESL